MEPHTTFYTILAIWLGVGVLLAVWLVRNGRHQGDERNVLRQAGVTTAIVGVLTIPFALFVPFGVYTRHSSAPGEAGETTHRLESMWSMGVEPIQWIWLAVIAGMALIIGVSSLVPQSGYAQSARWKAAIVLVILTLLGSFTIGWMFVPVTLLAFVTAVLGRRAVPYDEYEEAALEERLTQSG